MSLTYNSVSVTESFDLTAAIGEALYIYVYGAEWQSSTWLSNPDTALSAVNDAFDSVTDLTFTGIMILSNLNSVGTGMAFAAVEPTYKGKYYLNPGEVTTLRTAIINAPNTGETGTNLTYNDVVIAVSQSAT